MTIQEHCVAIETDFMVNCSHSDLLTASHASITTVTVVNLDVYVVEVPMYHVH